MAGTTENSFALKQEVMREYRKQVADQERRDKQLEGNFSTVHRAVSESNRKLDSVSSKLNRSVAPSQRILQLFPKNDNAKGGMDTSLLKKSVDRAEQQLQQTEDKNTQRNELLISNINDGFKGLTKEIRKLQGTIGNNNGGIGKEILEHLLPHLNIPRSAAKIGRNAIKTAEKDAAALAEREAGVIAAKKAAATKVAEEAGAAKVAEEAGAAKTVTTETAKTATAAKVAEEAGAAKLLTTEPAKAAAVNTTTSAGTKVAEATAVGAAAKTATDAGGTVEKVVENAPKAGLFSKILSGAGTFARGALHFGGAALGGGLGAIDIAQGGETIEANKGHSLTGVGESDGTIGGLIKSVVNSRLAGYLQTIWGGATSGAAAGSIVPGVGTIAGGIGGAVGGAAYALKKDGQFTTKTLQQGGIPEQYGPPMPSLQPDIKPDAPAVPDPLAEAGKSAWNWLKKAYTTPAATNAKPIPDPINGGIGAVYTPMAYHPSNNNLNAGITLAGYNPDQNSNDNNRNTVAPSFTIQRVDTIDFSNAALDATKFMLNLAASAMGSMGGGGFTNASFSPGQGGGSLDGFNSNLSAGLGGTDNSPGSSQMPTSAIQKQRGQQAMAYFTSQGWTKEQASGIVASIQNESNFNPSLPGDNGEAFGIAQWHSDRREAIAKGAGIDVTKAGYEDQLKAIQYELTQGGEKGAGQRLRGAKDAGEAGAIVSQYYERPGDVVGQANARANVARQWDKNYNPDDPNSVAQANKPDSVTTTNAVNNNDGWSNTTAADAAASKPNASAKPAPTPMQTAQVTQVNYPDMDSIPMYHSDNGILMTTMGLSA